MRSFVVALRAVGARLVMQLYIPAVIGAAALFVLLVAGTLWLTTYSQWWWLLFIPITSLFCIVLAFAAVIFFLMRFLTPPQTKTQKQAVKQFTDKIQGVAEVVGTPKIIILFRVVRSIAAPSKETYLADLVSNRELGKDFRDLQRSFDT